MHALKTFIGFDEPSDLATTSLIPTTSQAALIAPPAIIPVPDGAALNKTDKVKLKEINKELSTLSPKFSNNVLDAQNSFELWITDEDDLAGLPSNAINAAKMAAKAKSKDKESKISPFFNYLFFCFLIFNLTPSGKN